MTLEQIKAESLAKGCNFFSTEIKNAYKTRYSKRTAEGTGGVFFVTSEEIPSPSGIPERRFAVRSYNPVSGEVALVSALGQYPTDYAAHCAAKKLAQPVEPATLPEASTIATEALASTAVVTQPVEVPATPENVAVPPAVTEATVIPFPAAANS